MIVPLLLATALTVRPPHLSVQTAARPIVGVREAPQRLEEATLNLFAYCDAKGQATIMATNAGPTTYVLEWTLTAMKPGFPPDRWSSVSHVEPGQFEGWMSPAPYLHLDLRYEVDGVPFTNSIDAFCPGAAALGRGPEEWSAR
ncbi:MAG TPA: hypothetical protein VLJ18_01550 [Thermoanaerobaculia bacterium]|nr:hypothetical protein [Thermoanaerobaculia bacterium]